MEAHPELPPVEKVLNKLIDVAGLVEKRKGVKDIQERRIREAVNLVKNDETTTVKGSKREAYLTFLKLTREVVGDAGVVLCAIALGSSAVGGMKDRVKVELPYALKAKLDLSCNEQLNKLTERYFDTSLSTSSEEGSQPAHNSIETNSITETVIDATPSSQIQQAYLTGDVYKLNTEDMLLVANSQGIIGEILLTDTYNVNATSFITIPISVELTNRLIIQRPRFM